MNVSLTMVDVNKTVLILLAAFNVVVLKDLIYKIPHIAMVSDISHNYNMLYTFYRY